MFPKASIMPPKCKPPFWSCLLALFCFAPSGVAQDRVRIVDRPGSAAQGPAEEVLRVDTRVVFIDALVKDKKTGAPVTDLARENFAVLDDGRQRELTYFSAGDGERRPRALMLVIDFYGHWGRTFHTKETVSRLASALAKLPAEDEVAVAVSWLGKADSPCEALNPKSPFTPAPVQVLQDFTRDRGRIAAALDSVPALSAQYERDYERADWDFELENATSGVACAAEALRRAAGERRNSRPLMVVAADDLTYFPFAVREEMIRGALETGAAVNLLRIRTFFLTNWAAAVAKKTDFRGKDGAFDVVADAAKQTGGEMAKVGSAKKYAEAFERLISGLPARYSLGFTLGEDEREVGRLHKLEVRVKARDARGKERKVVVSGRGGYYVPELKRE
jgi:VWFA-related protein